MCVESATEISLTFPSNTSAIRRLKVSRLEYDALRLALTVSNMAILLALGASARSIFLTFENCSAVSAELEEKKMTFVLSDGCSIECVDGNCFVSAFHSSSLPLSELLLLALVESSVLLLSRSESSEALSSELV